MWCIFYSLKLARTNFLSDSNCCQINESNLEDPKEIPIQKEDFGDENCVQS